MDSIEELLRRRREVLEQIDGQIRTAYQKPATLLFTDIVGSTEFFERAGDIAGRQMIQTHNDLLFPIIAGHGGQIIKTIGDSIMARFEDPREAVRCAIGMQKALSDHNAGRPEPEQINVRMGLHFGSAVQEEQDLFGDMVNTAARVEARAAGGEILISGSLASQLSGAGFPLVALGSDMVKGKKQKIEFHLVNWSGIPVEQLQVSWRLRSGAAAGQAARLVTIRRPPDLQAEAAELRVLSSKGNPYLNRVMIPHPELFFGRKRIVKKILSRLAAERPQSVSLVGERRIGKSSLLNFLRSPPTRLQYLEEPERCLFLFLDFQQLRDIDEDQFLAFLISELHRQLGQVLELALEPTFDDLRFLCESLTSRGFRLLLLLDEFEVVTRNERLQASFYSLMRSLANNYSLALLTVSSRNLKDMCVTHQIADSPFFNIFSVQHLGLFSPEEAMSLIRDPSAARGLPLEALAGEILALGGLYPFFLQIACSAWYEYLESEAIPAEAQAGRGVPKAVLEAFREEAEPHLEYVLQTLPQEESACLQAVLGDQAADPAAQEALARKGYLVASGTGGFEPFSEEFRRAAERFYARRSR